jgi:hypothetical protein
MKREISIVASAWALFPFETPSAKPGLVHFHLTLSYAKIHPAGKLIDRRVWKSQSCSLKSLD